MEYVILGLLITKKMTLYELNKIFKMSVSLFYSASYGSLNAAVKKLLKNGFVSFAEEFENGRNKKIYNVTLQGEKAFKSWMFSDIPEQKLDLVAISRVFHLGLIENKEDKKKILNHIIDKYNEVVEKLLGIRDIIHSGIFKTIDANNLSEVAKYKLKTIDYGLKSYQFCIEWYGDLLKELE